MHFKTEIILDNRTSLFSRRPTRLTRVSNYRQPPGKARKAGLSSVAEDKGVDGLPHTRFNGRSISCDDIVPGAGKP